MSYEVVTIVRMESLSQICDSYLVSNIAYQGMDYECTLMLKLISTVN